MIETAAQRYRRILAERPQQDEQLFDFKTPSGMDFKLRQMDLAQFMVSGIMPVDLAAKAVKMEGSSPQEIAKTLNVDEVFKSATFMRKVIQYVTVDPHIVEEAKEDNEISASEVPLEDATAIFNWAMPGGGRAESLDPFSAKRGSVPVVLPDLPGNEYTSQH